MMCRDKKAGGSPRPSAPKENRLSREDDFDDIMDSDETYSGQDETGEPLLEDESGESTADEEVEYVESTPLTTETVIVEMGAPPARPARPAAKKKKKAAKAKTTKPKAKKKAAK